jgi:hypothetical protein
MRHLTWVFLVLAIPLSLGCGSDAGPQQITPETQAEIDANDAAVDAAESAQANQE